MTSSATVQILLIFIVVIIAVLLFFLPTGKTKQNLPLSLFLLIICLHIFMDFTFEIPVFNNIKIHLIPSTFIFFYAPLFYFHTCEICGQSTNKKRIHYLLFFILTFYYVFCGFYNVVFFLIYMLQYWFYVVSITQLLKRKRLIKSSKVIWIQFIFYSFGLIWLFAIIANILGLLNMPEKTDIIELTSFAISIIFFVGLLFFTVFGSEFLLNHQTIKADQNLLTKKNNSEIK